MARYLTLSQIKKQPTAKPRNTFSLYRKDINGRWTRISEREYSYDTAKFVFQNRLVAGYHANSILAIRQVSR
jgi:hypothetical protein